VCKRKIFTLFLMFFSFFLMVEPALAGPGGKIASTMFDSTWGKVLLVLLFIFFLPLIAVNSIKLKMAEKRAFKDLAFMSHYSEHFDWLRIEQRVKDSFLRVHNGWQDEDLSDVSSLMTESYLRNQQQVYLDKWKQKGLVNICNIKIIKQIKPLMVVHRNHKEGHRESTILVTVKAEMNDYLKHRETGAISEGNEEYKTVTTVWTFSLVDDEWKVADINQSNTIMPYVKMLKNLPSIQSTVTE